MFGRVRAASTSLDETLESHPSKFLKHDSFSIYEATLMKLKIGSQCYVDHPPVEEAMDMESDSSGSCVSSYMESLSVEPHRMLEDRIKLSQQPPNSLNEKDMDIDTDCCSETASCTLYIIPQSMVDAKQNRTRNASIVDLFTRYKDSRNLMAKCNGTLSCHSVENKREKSEYDCFSSLSDCQI